jgi:hypothetical protein
MTEPVPVGEVLPGVLAQVLDRAGQGYDRWAELVAQAGYCAHPIRLAGRVEHADRATGEVREVYSTDREPDGVLLKGCGNRLASRCPACSAVHQADTYQVVAAGLRGGKGLPATVADHPRLFVTYTAPSFGKVHTRATQGRLVLPCHPYRQGAVCPHGRRDGCWHRHQENDQVLGEPLCPQCYDSEGQVLWNALAPELWRRTTEYTRRALARLAGLTLAECNALVRVAFVKVAEFQRRGAIHFHAIIRLDAAPPKEAPGRVAPPPAPFTADLLERAVREAAARVYAPLPPLGDHPGEPARCARWGAQLDVRHLRTTVEQSAEQAAAYLAKYVTKSTEALGARLDRRLQPEDVDHLDAPAHVAELVHAAWRLGERPSLAKLRLRAWAHLLGFGGHFATKSRRYSTTMTALRRARIAYAIRRRRGDLTPLGDTRAADHHDQAVLVLASWTYAGRGYATEGEAWLALSAAARAREHRRIAREECFTTTAA